MDEALDLSAPGIGSTIRTRRELVIVKDGEVVGHGYIYREHAEIVGRVEKLVRRALGSTVYVTWNRARSKGRTPPCPMHW